MNQPQKLHAETNGQSAAISRWDDEGGAGKPAVSPVTQVIRPVHGAPRMLTSLVIDDSEHNRDGLLLHSWDRDDAVTVTAFIGRKVIDGWVHQQEMPVARDSLFRHEYTALGRRNLAAIQRIVVAKYESTCAFNDPRPFVDVRLADIVASGETLNLGSSSRFVQATGH
jgi:hypothetical protein